VDSSEISSSHTGSFDGQKIIRSEIRHPNIDVSVNTSSAKIEGLKSISVENGAYHVPTDLPQHAILNKPVRTIRGLDEHNRLTKNTRLSWIQFHEYLSGILKIYQIPYRCSKRNWKRSWAMRIDVLNQSLKSQQALLLKTRNFDQQTANFLSRLNIKEEI
jgi:hypothetical protein